VYEFRDHKLVVEQWVNAQPALPSRKEAQDKFPDAPQRVVKAALQSRKDREGTK